VQRSRAAPRTDAPPPPLARSSSAFTASAFCSKKNGNFRFFSAMALTPRTTKTTATTKTPTTTTTDVPDVFNKHYGIGSCARRH
jgi:hypothetical protein